MATITNGKNGSTREVKNLGWLLRHSSEVIAIHLTYLEGGRGHLRVYLDRQRIYRTEFESFTLMQKWVKRPCLRRVPVETYSEPKRY